MSLTRKWSRRVGRKTHHKGFVTAIAGIAVGMMATHAQATIEGFLFDFDVPPTPESVGAPGIVPLVDVVVPGAASFLGDLVAAGKPASVKVRSLPADMSLFDAVVIENVFLDFESASAAADKDTFLAALAGTASSGAKVGNFRFEPAFPDPTIAAPYSDRDPADFIGLEMAAPQAYPGAPDQRNPAAGNSSAPNIISALFTLPIQRVSDVSEAIDDYNVPYVVRFNNFGNPALDTGDDEFDMPGQVPSGSDFAAQMAHYKARGADSVTLFEPGIKDETKEDFHADALEGWKFWDDVAGGEGVTLTNRITVEGVGAGADLIATGTTMTTEKAGAVWSGVANADVLKILISNLSDSDLSVELPNSINGLLLSDRNFVVTAGSHLGIEFGAVGFDWALSDSGAVFDEDTDRSKIGIPEPASLAMLLMGAGLVGARRRSNK